jgi:small-conductance mechanosensitive channel
MWEWVASMDVQWTDLVVPLGITAGLIAVVVVVVPRVIDRIDRMAPVDIRLTYWRLLVAPLCWTIGSVGLYVTVLLLPLSDTNRHRIDVALAVVLTVVVVYAVLRVLNTALGTYHAELRQLRDARAAYVGGIRKIANIVVIVVGALIITGQLGLEIGPALAGLGIAGLAVALALQDTLSNFFSGFYLMLDQPIRPGDYVELDGGQEGFVEEIGWRNTRIRPFSNNLVIIPNAKLAESVIVNWHQPVPEMSVYIWCGVAYHSDLEEVERVAIEVGREVQSRVEGTNRDWDPIVRFKEFADSNITFVTVLRVFDPTQRFLLEHEMIKALFRSFNEQGIEISFPMRTVVMREERPPDHAGRTGGVVDAAE